ncbi:MAG: hypothetical protein ABSC94_08635 [Polyangiaceae bacterium]|jgi:ribosomal protein S8
MKQAFVKRLTAAVEEVSMAQKRLADLLHQVRAAPRAEKTTIGVALADALSRLKNASTALTELKKRVPGGPGGDE